MLVVAVASALPHATMAMLRRIRQWAFSTPISGYAAADVSLLERRLGRDTDTLSRGTRQQKGATNRTPNPALSARSSAGLKCALPLP
jgi:hypothetical protein